MLALWIILFRGRVQEDPHRVRFAIWGGVAEQKAWATLAEDFQRKHPDTPISIQLIPGQYDVKLLAMLAARTAPDLFSLPLADFGPQGVLTPIERFMANDPNLPVDDLFDGMLRLGQWDGVQYALPATLGPQVLFFNVRHVEEAGLESPIQLARRGEWNWERFLDYCQKLTKKGEDGRVVQWGFLKYTPLWTYISLNGGKAFDEDFTQCYFDDPKVYKPIQRLADLSLVHKVAPPPAVEAQIGTWQAFARGDASMFISGPWQVSRLKDMADPYDIAPPPTEPGGRTITLAGVGTGIWVRSKRPEAAYRWISFLASRDALRIWAGLGFDIPASRYLAEHLEEWADPRIIPPNFRLFYELVPSILASPPATSPFIPKKAQDLINDTFTLVWTGKKDARTAFGEIIPRVNQILRTGR
jgi:multiple sugar transport system substrate-binding protein